MKRSILLTCTGVLLTACASGADVTEDDTAPDSAMVEVLDEAAPGENAEGAGKQAP